VTEERVGPRGGHVDAAVVDALLASGPLPDAAQRVLQAVAQVLGWQRAELWAVSSTDGRLALAASWSSEALRATAFGESALGRTFAIGESLPGRVWAAGAPLRIDDLQAAGWFQRRGAAAAAGLRSALGFPVFDGETVCGVVVLLGEGDEASSAVDEQVRLLGGLLGHLLVRQRSEEQRVVAEAEADSLVADLRRLHELGVRLLASHDLTGMLGQVLEAAVELQGASAGVLMLYDPDRDDLYTVASVGFSAEYLEAVGRVPVGRGACGTAVAEQRVVVVADVTRDPLFAPYLHAAELGGYRSAYSMPLQTRGGQLLGTLATYFPLPYTPPERDRWLVALYAAQAAEAIRHSQLLEQARRAEAARDATLARLRRHTAQLEGLNAAALAVTACPTADDALVEVTRQARRLLAANQAAASLVRGGDWAGARHVDVCDTYAAPDRVAAPPHGSGLHTLVCETNRPLRLTKAELAAHPRWRRLGRHGDEHPPANGWLAAPLTAADGTNMGVLQLSDKVEGDFTAEDETLLVQLARLASVAIRNAELLAERTQVAQTLQHSLLPPALPRLPGLQLAARFRPMNGAQVGGDFYDVFQVGRNDWAVVVGDVCGKGAQAASLTALVRYTIRAAAVATRRPADILAHLNEVMLRHAEDHEPRFATVAYVRLRLASEGATATVACAGHPPPLLRRADATVTSIDAPGTLVGALADVAFTQKTVRLRRGDTLLLYTDGITEARTHNGMFEDDLVATLAASPAGHADALLDHLDATLLAHATDTARDDIATLAIHRPHTPPRTVTISDRPHEVEPALSPSRQVESSGGGSGGAGAGRGRG
jgi:serine phosphatase RsbU (regulator of sigma subunit)